MAGEKEFRAALAARLLVRASGGARGVGDVEWSSTRAWSTSLRARLRDAATRAGLSRRRFDPDLAARRLEDLLPSCAGFGQTMDLLEDADSRDLLLDVLARRVLGPHHVTLPVSPAGFEAVRRRMAKLRVDGDTAPGPFGLPLYRHEYRGIRLHVDPLQLVAFELDQYAPALPGETVVDGGAGYGETALVYAQQVGPRGRVIAVELDDANLELIERNLELNPTLGARITVVGKALWATTGGRVTYGSLGGQSSVSGDGASVATVAIDDLGVDRVDVLKLDVEGAESDALRGAQETLRRDRPRLAVAAYHRPDDLATLPSLINRYEPSYRYRLGHFTPGYEETILTARAV